MWSRWIACEQVLFNDSIMHNIAYGRPSATEEQVIQAAKQAVCCFISHSCCAIYICNLKFQTLLSGNWFLCSTLCIQRLHDAILRMPDGYLTMVGERGLKVRPVVSSAAFQLVVTLLLMSFPDAFWHFKKLEYLCCTLVMTVVIGDFCSSAGERSNVWL